MKRYLTILFALMAIGAYAQPTANIDFTFDPFCAGSCDGQAQITVTGGVPPYTDVTPTGSGIVVNQPTSGVFEYFQMCGLFPYNIFVEDANGDTAAVTITLNEPVPVSGVISSVDATCSNLCDGQLNANVTGGTPPYTFSWSTGQTTSVISNLCQGTYTVAVTDANGCFVQLTGVVNAGSVAAQATTGSTPAYCNDGSVTINVPSIYQPFTVDWNTGHSSVLVNNVGPGTYTATVTDSMGCPTDYSVIVADSSGGAGCSEVTGRVFVDANNDCTDNGEAGIETAIVQANPGSYVVLTDSTGAYTMNLPYGSYSLEHNGNLFYGPSCGNTLPVTTSAGTPVSSGNDFADTLSPVTDVETNMAGWAVRPVIPFTFYFHVNYNGLSQSDVLAYYVPDPAFVISSTTPAFDYSNGDTLFWDIQNMGASTHIQINGNAPNASIGDSVSYCYGAWPNIIDIDSTNNEHCSYMFVTGSYDPNEKHVMPQGNGPNGEIYLEDSLMTYTVLFQNTGNDTAFTVVIMDTLSPLLDPSTFQYIGASHNCIPEILPGNVLKFTFNNILLPDSTTNEPESHGFVHFKIEVDPTVQIGDVIENTAGIYFDYNDPIITNTTVNTYVNPPVGNGIEEMSSVDVLVYPNPNNGTFNVITNAEQQLNMTIYTVAGKQVKTTRLNNGVNRLNLQNELSTGMYIYTLNDGQKVVDRGRIIIE